MADPITMLTIGGAVSGLVGGVVSGNAAQAQAEAQANQLKAQADADRFNRQIALQNIEIVKGQTQAEFDKADRERRLRLGANIAAGASTDVLSSNATQEALNLLTIRSEGLLREREFQTQANLLESSARSADSQVSSVIAAGKASKSAAILGGVSSAFSAGTQGFGRGGGGLRASQFPSGAPTPVRNPRRF